MSARRPSRPAPQPGECRPLLMSLQGSAHNLFKLHSHWISTANRMIATSVGCTLLNLAWSRSSTVSARRPSRPAPQPGECRPLLMSLQGSAHNLFKLHSHWISTANRMIATPAVDCGGRFVVLGTSLGAEFARFDAPTAQIRASIAWHSSRLLLSSRRKQVGTSAQLHVTSLPGFYSQVPLRAAVRGPGLLLS